MVISCYIEITFSNNYLSVLTNCLVLSLIFVQFRSACKTRKSRAVLFSSSKCLIEYKDHLPRLYSTVAKNTVSSRFIRLSEMRRRFVCMNSREVLPWRANTRGEGVLAARNDRMLVERASQSHEGSSAGYLGITMEITTRLGSHTIAVASFVGRFVSTRASDTAPRSRCRRIFFFHLPRLALSCASIRPKVERAHARADT